MASVNHTWPHCVNQMGKTHSKPLAARHGRETAWARHAMCESTFTVQTHRSSKLCLECCAAHAPEYLHCRSLPPPPRKGFWLKVTVFWLELALLTHERYFVCHMALCKFVFSVHTNFTRLTSLVCSTLTNPACTSKLCYSTSFHYSVALVVLPSR